MEHTEAAVEPLQLKNMGLGASALIINPMLISLLYVKVNKVIIATLVISISHRCNSLGVLL